MEKTIWGIHMDWSLELEPVEKGFIAIGWDDLGDLSKLQSSREAFKAALAEAYPEKKPGAIPVDAGILFRFVHEMSKGDLVVYPSKPNRVVNLGTVEGDYVFDGSNIGKYPNRRLVKWIRQIPRTEFSLDALHEIGAFITLFKIGNNAEEFLAAFEGKESKVDTGLEEAGAVSIQAEESAADFILKRLKAGINPYQFEEFVGHLLECMGYHARVTQKSGDGGVDIIAHKDELGFEPPVIKVQCKQTQSTIGQPEVAQLYGNVEATEFGLFVTLGSYSADARRFERAKRNLRLIDGKGLIELIEAHYSDFEPRYQVLLPLKRIYVPGIIAHEQS